MPLSQTSTAMSSLHHEVKSMSWLFPCKIKPMLEVSVVTQSTLSHDPICGARVLGRQAETCEPWDCGSWCYCLSAGPHSVVLHLLFPLFWPLSHLSHLLLKLLLYIFIITHVTGKEIATAICEASVDLQVWAHRSWKAALNVAHHQNIMHLLLSNDLHSTFLCT